MNGKKARALRKQALFLGAESSAIGIFKEHNITFKQKLPDEGGVPVLTNMQYTFYQLAYPKNSAKCIYNKLKAGKEHD